MKRNQALLIVFVVAVAITVVVIMRNHETVVSDLPTESPLGLSLSNNIFSLHYSSDWGLATKPEQVSVRSYIPACSEGFEYCFYYAGEKYKGTNFESAGIRINERADLKTETSCLNTPPKGRTDLTHRTSTSTAVSTSVFAPLGDAGAGHYATGELYRLAIRRKCYEFETRIGESQFANYSPGTVKEFTSANRATVASELRRIIENITLSSGDQVSFPRQQ